ncbi:MULTISPECIES: hypothetical protein [Aquimarina]|uniref:hypothetical protein n=1 Tax=Aquimarina TaxID=290174 RepID=UPI000942CBD6|nr:MULTISPECIES: hypothetical protein [Aquimarina]
MIKKIGFGIVFSLLGMVIALFLTSFFRNQIQLLFQLTTNDRIQYFGKGFYLFLSTIYYISFTIAIVVLGMANLTLNFKLILKNVLIWIGIFTITLVIICAINANFKIIACTTCDDGILSMHHNAINYGIILSISAVFASIPSILKISKQKKSN